MALTWTDKVDNVDNVVAEDINSIAHAVIQSEIDIGTKADVSTTLAGYGILDAYTKTEIDTQIGDIETALDNIIVIQNALIGGGA